MPKTKNDGLPRRLFFKHGAYFYIQNNKWINLGRNKIKATKIAAELNELKKDQKIELLKNYGCIIKEVEDYVK